MSAANASIVTMGPADEDRIAQVCGMLVRSFRALAPTWVPTLEAARSTVAEALQPGMFSRVLELGDRVVGWVGARHDYGSVWELHPLVIDEAMRGRGYGRTLVDDIERLVEREGALTLVLGTSDEMALTSLAGRDLYRSPLAALQKLEASAAHPLGFWRKVGFTVVGVVPDAEGPGKPTILLAKRVAGAA